MSQYQKKYNPHRSQDWNYGGKNWRLSRSKIDLFIECPRCFYLDNKAGTSRPRGPSFTLNVAVDALLKKEFDLHRKAASVHPLVARYGVEAIPFQHPQMEVWRENFKGIAYDHPELGFTVCGAIDDVWITPQKQLIVVDYKATSKEGTIETLEDSSWEDQYRRQIGVYQWLLRKNGFDVSDVGYFVYANARSDKAAFDAQLEFEVTLVPCEGTTSWIDAILPKIKATLENDAIPAFGADCEFCPYREAAGKTFQKIHRAGKGIGATEHSKKIKGPDVAVPPQKTSTLF